MNRLIILAFLAGLTASLFGGTLGVIAAESSTAVRTEAVFVYDSLDNPIVRLYGCRCFSSETPVRVRGFARGVDTLIPSEESTIRGKYVAVSTTERKRLDKFIGAPETHYRTVVETEAGPAWAYIKRKGY